MPMHIWSPINGPVEIICEPLLPSLFTARLDLADGQGGGRDIPGVKDADGAFHFQLSAADAQIVRDNPQASLLLTTEHIKIPQSDQGWGWLYTVLNPPGHPTPTAVPVDQRGYFRAGPFDYPPGGPAPIAASAQEIKFQ